MHTKEEQIKAKALALGFQKAGIAEIQPLEEEGGRLREWLGRGLHATMDWMARDVEKRLDPSLIVPNARSVISVAMNYYTPTVHNDDRGIGKVSRYAWGDDYHDIVTAKLKTLWGWLQEEFPGVEGRYYVDTGPVMDKVWAQRAGIGWIGKHTNVITPELGSWVFLGEIITTLPLTADAPATDHCGTCTLCIDACPTAAITEPYVVDSNQCLSYLTIEHRGEFNETSPTEFEGWIYGCDVCQDVCPWNEKFGTTSSEPGFQPREWNRAPNLQEWSRMTREEFSRMFKGSPIKRTKWEGLVRNVRAAVVGGRSSKEAH